eukprot:CAMPEP_0172924090 /NCGR_PEP_ID=MMETSP1075-20121228/211009_1 /TAXON_ID=2916 /ORGANISM="Ceratium fusus, Strain PA161109" /LENGTH=65 /DNA_ID=CAMNT_0013784691 /DNA_START=71 /DNA_END=265 /DNA_ORIENTATION=-
MTLKDVRRSPLVEGLAPASDRRRLRNRFFRRFFRGVCKGSFNASLTTASTLDCKQVHLSAPTARA